jgi:hypothetical protein
MTVDEFIAFIKAQNIPGNAVIRARGVDGYIGEIDPNECFVWTYKNPKNPNSETVTYFDVEPEG